MMKIALAGNPNCGKTTIFNQLTGARQHVGNYPGVTVEKKSGSLKIGEDKYEVIDLPGIYSLSAYSEDELVARNYIVDERPELIINIVDASNLERNLYLSIQLMEMNVPIILALNMQDMAIKRGLEIDAEKLSKLLGMPVVPTVGHKKKGISKLIEEIREHENFQWKYPLFSYSAEIDLLWHDLEKHSALEAKEFEKYNKKWLTLKLIEYDEQITEIVKPVEGCREIFQRIEKVAKHLDKTLDDTTENIISGYRYGFSASVVKKCTTRTFEVRKSISDKIDLLLTNRLLGPIILMLVLWLFYEFTFTASEFPVSWLESFFGWLHNIAENNIPPGLFQSLVVSGIY